MYIDNQASIISTQSIYPAPGHHLLDILHDEVARMKKKPRNIRITAHWIPSHKEVEGNEEADRQAKRAAKGDTDSPLHRLPAKLRTALPNSKSAIQQAMTKTLKTEAATTLQNSPQWRKLCHVDLSMPSSVATAWLKTASRPRRAKNEASHSRNYGWAAKAVKPWLELWLGPKMETLARKQHPGSSSRRRHLLYSL